VTKTDVAVEMYWICALILPRCTQESVVIYGHLLRYCEGAKYWYRLGNTAKVLVFVLQYWLQICIGIGIDNTFFRQYWYWYCQYFVKVLLTTLGNGFPELILTVGTVFPGRQINSPLFIRYTFCKHRATWA